MLITLQLTEIELKNLIFAHFAKILGDVPFKPENLHIETKSRQNFKAEWEQAAFRATYTGNTTS